MHWAKVVSIDSIHGVKSIVFCIHLYQKINHKNSENLKLPLKAAMSDSSTTASLIVFGLLFKLCNVINLQIWLIKLSETIYF